jgi:hypothetical protein
VQAPRTPSSAGDTDSAISWQILRLYFEEQVYDRRCLLPFAFRPHSGLMTATGAGQAITSLIKCSALQPDTTSLALYPGKRLLFALEIVANAR